MFFCRFRWSLCSTARSFMLFWGTTTAHIKGNTQEYTSGLEGYGSTRNYSNAWHFVPPQCRVTAVFSENEQNKHGASVAIQGVCLLCPEPERKSFPFCCICVTNEPRLANTSHMFSVADRVSVQRRVRPNESLTREWRNEFAVREQIC